MINSKNEILQGLNPLYEKAEKERLWFFCDYQNLWYSPKELRQLQSEGRFVWGAANWKLRNPMERVEEMEETIENLTKKYDAFMEVLRIEGFH